MSRARLVRSVMMVAALAGCGRGASHDSGSDARPAATTGTAMATPGHALPSAAPNAAPKAALTSRDTIPFDESEIAKPTLRYGSFRVAADSARAMVSRSLGVYADSAVWRGGAIAFDYHDSVQVAPPFRGGPAMWILGGRETPPIDGLSCSLSIANSNEFDVERAVLDALRHVGWVDDYQYSADGPDGTTMALVCEEAIFRYAGSWDGGDDVDTSYVPAPGASIEFQIVPRFPVRRGARAGGR